MNSQIGVNMMQMTGFVNQYITLFESKKGTPAVRFTITAGERGFSFIQNVVIYGTYSIELSKRLKSGDLIFVTGKKMILSLPGRDSYREHTACIVSNVCYILETQIDREKRI